jgi:hypothetical protein
MAKVTGLGGAFLRANDPKARYAWNEQHLGISASEGCVIFFVGHAARLHRRVVFPKVLRLFSRFAAGYAEFSRSTTSTVS